MPAVSLPKSVVLRGTGFSVHFHEDMVLFADEDRCGPCFAKLQFERRAGCWYVSIHSLSEGAMVSHIMAAQELIDEWFGGNFQFTNGEHRP